MRFQISQQGGGKYAVIDIQTRQLSANVQLLHAVGGGWSADALAQTDAAPALAGANEARSP